MHWPRSQKVRVRGQAHTVTKAVMVARLLVTTAGIPYTYTPLCYLRPLPAWVCMSIRLPMFSSLHLCTGDFVLCSSWRLRSRVQFVGHGWATETNQQDFSWSALQNWVHRTTDGWKLALKTTTVSHLLSQSSLIVVLFICIIILGCITTYTRCLRCAPIATDGVAWSVCLSVCWSRSWDLQKWLNRSRCQLSVRLGLAQGRNHMLEWGRYPSRKRANFGGCPAHWKALGVSATALCTVKKIKARLRQPCVMLQTGRCNISLPPPPVKTRPCDAAFH